jgi:hypothetical protein
LKIITITVISHQTVLVAFMGACICPKKKRRD